MILGLTQIEYGPAALKPKTRFRDPGTQTVVLFHFGAGLFRAALFEHIGTLAAELGDSEDWDWFLRAKEAGAGWAVSEEIALIHRRHGANMTEGRGVEQLQLMQVLARAAARRRSRWGSAIPDFDRLSDRIISAQQTGDSTRT
jgi:hypothetical protein